MTDAMLPLLAAAGLFATLVACIEAGRRIGRRMRAEEVSAGLSSVDGAVFALLGLILAFTFTGAASRFEARRDLIRQEANDIGTAYLRLDLLLPTRQPALRAAFRDYLDSRLAFYAVINDPAADAAEARVTALQARIWTAAVAATAEVPGPQAATLLLPAINDMIDITTTRKVATLDHPPQIIFVMLVVLSMASALVLGFGMAPNRRRSALHIAGFAVAVTMTITVTLDLEYPRAGLIRVSSADRILRDVRASMR